jgi:Cytochrome c
MRRVAVIVFATLATLPGLAWPLALGAADADPLAIGRRIYREGVLPNGQPLRGTGPAGVVLTGAQAACATCHRRSGYGSSEGPIEVRAITGPALFGERPAPPAPGIASAVTTAQGGISAAEAARAQAMALRSARAVAFAGVRQRPTYDDASVVRAVLEGVDVTGRRMHASMPRYGLEPDAIASLTAYLKALSAQVSPGVTEDAVHFATVIQPGTDPAQRQALLDILQAFMRDRNQSQRVEARREQAGQVHLGRIYRRWVLHVWDLSGPSDTWARQLEAYNARQPVFALVSGLGQASWRPIHEFSERFELPCIFPQADVPVLAEHDFYTVYLSRGMTLEAQALAQFLKTEGGRGPVIQVYRSDPASAAAAEAFRVAWGAGAGAAPVDVVLEGSPGAAFWQQLAEQNPVATLVLWLPSRDLDGAQALSAAGSKVKAIYLSSSLNAGQRTGLAADGEGRVRLVYPQDLPAAREARIEVVRRWLRNNGITPSDEKLQMNAYLAATVTGMLMMHGKDTYSREFMLERMEHRLGTAIETSIYPHLSLGPGQRYASKGSYIMRVDGADERQLTPVSDWIVP